MSASFVAPVRLAAEAAVLLGWDGVVLPPMVLLGRRVVAVATLIGDIHERRTSSGWGPVTDRVSVSTWDWPEMARCAPPPAVALRGIIAPARHWRTGLTGAAPFAELCPTALLLPTRIAGDVECWGPVERYGHALLAATDTDVDVVFPERSRWRPEGIGTLSGSWRLVHELVYECLLGTRP